MAPRRSSAPKKELTTTSFAILGLLALRPWSTYELAKQMERSLHNFWPRAESKLYEEPKALVAHGYASARKEMTGKRPRTVYRITAEGRRALRSWLKTPGAPPSTEFEAIVKVFFSDQGSKRDLLEQLDAVEAWSLAEIRRSIPIMQEYLGSGGPFPERMRIIKLMTRFLHERAMFYDRWATWARNEVSAWPAVRGGIDEDGFGHFREILEEATALVEARDERDRGTA